MIIFLVGAALLCLWGVKYDIEGKEYLSVDRTNSIKGIFIILVFFGHIVNYGYFNSALDAPYMIVKRVLGQCVVSMFLFYSGYGICQKLRTEGGVLSEYSKA